MLEFEVATEAKLAEEDGDEKLIEVKIADKIFLARRPTPGQTNAIFASSGSVDMTRTVWKILEKILVPNDPKTPANKRHAEYRDLRQMVFDGIVKPDLLFGGDELNGRGIVDGIIHEFSGYPTQPSEDSSPSPSASGARSTGRRPGKGSTSSTSG